MILLERKTPTKILALEALLRRLDLKDLDYNYFQESLARARFGFEGELRTDREWIEMPYLEEHFLFNGYETVNEFGTSHQMDTLLLTRNFVMLLETKNIIGRVDYDESKHQFERQIGNGEKESFSNPFDQLRRHSELLERILARQGLNLPIIGAAVMANSSTIIGNVPKTYPIFHLSGLRTFVRQSKNRNAPQISSAQLEKLAKHFLSLYQPIEYRLNISLNRIRKGVLCEKCGCEMGYKQGFWICPKCGERNKHALYRALDDYRLLVSNKITNREFRGFFKIDSMETASKILIRLNLESVGKFRGRYYIIPEDVLCRE